MKKKPEILIWAVMLTLIVLLPTGCSKAAKEEKEIKSVSVATASEAAYTNTYTLSGSVTPIETASLSFKLDGKIADVYVQEGDTVHTGQPVAGLIPEDYSLHARAAQAQYQAAEAEYSAAKLQAENEIPSKIAQAKAQLTLTQKTYERMQNLFQAQAISQSQLDEISAKLTADYETYQQALDAKNVANVHLIAIQAQLDQAAAASEKAANDLTETTITSPMNGVVLKKIMNAGETAAAGYPIVAVGRTDEIYIEIGIPDEKINFIRKGQSAEVSVYGTDECLEGSVAEISALADSNTRTFPVSIYVNNPKGTLKPGMIARVTLNTGSQKAVLIPLDSVLQRAEGSILYVYNAESGTVNKRTVTTGEIRGTSIEVLSGLKTGEQFVTEGQFMLYDGDFVQPKEEETP